MLKIYFLFITLCFSYTAFSKEDPTGPYYKNEFSFTVGTYSLVSNDVSLSGFGASQLGYHFFVTQKLAPFINLTNIFQNDNGVTSILTGFDFGGAFCLFNCVQEFQKVSDILMISQHSKWGLRLGLGFAQRNFHLPTTTLSYSGFMARPTLNYFLKEDLKLISFLKYTNLRNGSNSIVETTLGLGLAYDFESIHW